MVAEGVEDEATWRLLAAAGCHAAQGWFHARPMPAADDSGLVLVQAVPTVDDFRAFDSTCCISMERPMVVSHA